MLHWTQDVRCPSNILNIYVLLFEFLFNLNLMSFISGANESIIHVDDWQHSIPVPDNHDSHDVQISICFSLLLQDNLPEAGRYGIEAINVLTY